VKGYTRLAAMFLACAFLLTSAASAAGRDQRIRLKRGATEVRVSGRLTPAKSEARFVIRARAGQTLSIELSGPGPFSGAVISPSGKSEGQPGGGVYFNERLTESGDYRIHISEGNRGERRKVEFVLKIQLR
jgi:hypothetical protein